MKAIIQNLADITDSKQVYEAQPHPFLKIFIYILLAGVIALVAWMYYGEIDIVSKGRGTIRPNDHMSIIRSKSAGIVTENHLEEGAKVKKGDLLFSIDHEKLDIQKKQLGEKLAKDKEKMGGLKKYRKSVESETNLFSPTAEKQYYEKYVKYVQDGQALNKDVSIEGKNDTLSLEQTQLTKARCEKDIVTYTDKLSRLVDYKASVETENNQFRNRECTEKLLFDAYIYNRKEATDKIREKSETYELNKALAKENLLAPSELEDSKAALDLAENEKEKLKIDALDKIQKDIEDYTKLKEETEKEKEKLIIDPSLQQDKTQKRQLSIKQYKTNELVAVSDQIQAIDITLQSEQRELDAVNLGIDNCSVRAPIDGTINIIQNMNVGDLLSEGVEAARIIPKDSEMYKVEIFIPNSKIAGIKTGKSIEYQFDALPYKEYGKLKGQVINISTDASRMETNEMGISGYCIVGELANKAVHNYKGEQMQLKVGMTCDAYIIIEQKKILYYLLEKINLKE